MNPEPCVAAAPAAAAAAPVAAAAWVACETILLKSSTL
jgi:hypothetical protein